MSEQHYSRTCEAPTTLLQERLSKVEKEDIRSEIEKELQRRSASQPDCSAIRQKRALEKRLKQESTAASQAMNSGDSRKMK